MLSVIRNPCICAKYLSILMKKYTISLSRQSCQRRREKYWGEIKNMQIINLNIMREERSKISSAKEMGHSVVGGVPVVAGGVIGPAYRNAVGLELRAIAGLELWDGALVKPGQQMFGWVNGRESGHKHFVGCLRQDNLLYHPALYEASG